MTKVSYSIQSKSHVVLSVYDSKGNRAGVLVDETQNSGEYEIVWNLVDIKPGIYVCSLQVGNEMLKRKVVKL